MWAFACRLLHKRRYTSFLRTVENTQPLNWINPSPCALVLAHLLDSERSEVRQAIRYKSDPGQKDPRYPTMTLPSQNPHSAYFARHRSHLKLSGRYVERTVQGLCLSCWDTKNPNPTQCLLLSCFGTSSLSGVASG